MIQIGFYRASGTCLGSCGQRYSHVELRFCDDGALTSIVRELGRVHFIGGGARRLSSPKYSCFFNLQVGDEDAARIRARARECADSPDLHFSNLTMLWNFTPILRRWPRRSGLFCSQYVTELLQEGGFARDLDPYLTSPDRLFAYLAREEEESIPAGNTFLLKKEDV